MSGMEHTVRAVDEELKALRADIVRMGELAVGQVRAAVDAFARHDAAAAASIAAADERLDALDADIENRAVRFIALRQPMADDLRRPIVAMKTAMQLERCGDLAKNIAKRVGRMEGPAAASPAASIASLGALVADRLGAVVEAFGADDASRAHEVWSKDTDVDARHEEAMREVMSCMSGGGGSLSDCAHLLFIAKNLERIGDHATNIAELVHYQLTGDDLTDRPKL
jgi:phosphate transport system protein